MKKIDISIFVPVYNEEKILKKNILLIQKKLERLKQSFEIFIIDDNSTDETGKIGKELAQKEYIKYIKYDEGPSQRENLGKSFILASGKTIAFMDCDLSTNLNCLIY